MTLKKKRRPQGITYDSDNEEISVGIEGEPTKFLNRYGISSDCTISLIAVYGGMDAVTGVCNN